MGKFGSLASVVAPSCSLAVENVGNDQTALTRLTGSDGLMIELDNCGLFDLEHNKLTTLDYCGFLDRSCSGARLVSITQVVHWTGLDWSLDLKGLHHQSLSETVSGRTLYSNPIPCTLVPPFFF
jgi:hypothetical protein